jgi:uncharacterized protein YciU (UPF0263 family)
MIKITAKNGKIKGKEMKRRLIAIVAAAVLCLTACDTEANRVNYNITQDAENFNCYRRLVVINCIKGDVLFEMEGLMNINADTDDHQLEIIVETDHNVYKKHFIGLSDNVSYTVEDITGTRQDKYHYELNYNPKMWLPYSVENID